MKGTQENSQNSSEVSTSANAGDLVLEKKRKRKKRGHGWKRGKNKRNPLLKGAFSKEEDLEICEFIKNNGDEWKKIGELLERTEIAVKNRYYVLMRKTAKRSMPRKIANQLKKEELDSYFPLTLRNLRKWYQITHRKKKVVNSSNSRKKKKRGKCYCEKGNK
eukprot:TRINITY_DN215_c0_g1_i7.p2 TRINITY_DN215_c0_g1~~TRINITY_DN215_c0_g1_i7.p2  ORF type:complete len:162 (-),score=3.51 TRINITY_DN215_c0_g1_i7:415-900(-)